MEEMIIEEAAMKLGYELKDEQKTVISSVVAGHDVFAILLTGFGKSMLSVPAISV